MSKCVNYKLLIFSHKPKLEAANNLGQEIVIDDLQVPSDLFFTNTTNYYFPDSYTIDNSHTRQYNQNIFFIIATAGSVYHVLYLHPIISCKASYYKLDSFHQIKNFNFYQGF